MNRTLKTATWIITILITFSTGIIIGTIVHTVIDHITAPPSD